jgi:hypothetical protein
MPVDLHEQHDAEDCPDQASPAADRPDDPPVVVHPLFQGSPDDLYKTAR